MLYGFNIDARRRLREGPDRKMIGVRDADVTMGQTIDFIVKNTVNKGFSAWRFFDAELMGREVVERRNLLNESCIDRFRAFFLCGKFGSEGRGVCEAMNDGCGHGRGEWVGVLCGEL